MKAAGIMAVLGAALLSVGAFAQNNQQEDNLMANLSADQILAPEGRAAGVRHEIILVSERPVVVREAVARLTRTVDGDTISLPGRAWTVPNCAGQHSYPITVRPPQDQTYSRRQPGQPIQPDQTNQTNPADEADQTCRISVLAELDEPGRYVAKVSLFGTRGRPQELTLVFAYRRALGWAIGLVLAGLVAGFFITYWRGGGRDRARMVIEIKDVTEALEFLDAGQTDKPVRMKLVIARARELQAMLIRGAPVDPAEVAELGARPHQFAFLLDIESAGSTLPDDKRAKLALAIQGAIDKMMPSPGGKLTVVPDTELNAVRERLRELQAPPPSLAGREAEDSSGQPIGEPPLPITIRMSSGEARFAFALMEWVAALILMLVFAAVAMGTLYFGKPYWGSYGDLLAAFTVGFGAFAGAVASVDSFVQRARATG